jgi:hypothetical protein
MLYVHEVRFGRLIEDARLTAQLDDPVDVLGVTEEPSLAAALLALASHYDEQAAALVGTGADLLASAPAEAAGSEAGAALRQALAPRLRSLAGAATALESVARSALPPGDLLAAARMAGQPAPVPPSWPAPPSPGEVREVLARWARTRTRPRVPSDRFEGDLGITDASVIRLTVTRVSRHVIERRMWTGDAPPELERYEGDLADVARKLDDHGWGKARWEGIREGSVQRRDCNGCGGEGRTRCQRCNGGAFERCRPFEPCGACHGRGKAPRQRGMLLRPACAVCNGRGALPCVLCGGFGRRPCEACTGGLVPCERCHGHGRVTQYDLGVIERSAESHTEVDRAALERLGRGAERHFRTVATLTRPGRLAGIPERVDGAVRRLLDRASPEQVRQRVQIDVLPAVEVTYGHGSDGGTVRVLGSGATAEVRAAGTARPALDRLRRPLIALVVAAAAVAATVMVLLASRGGAP